MRSGGSKLVRVEEAIPVLYRSCPLAMPAAVRRWLGGGRRGLILEKPA